MPPKVLVSASVYKVFRIGISYVAKGLFGNGFVGIPGINFQDFIQNEPARGGGYSLLVNPKNPEFGPGWNPMIFHRFLAMKRF